VWPAAQAPAPSRQAPFQTGVTFVNVDAYPRQNGRLVEGLQAEDFAVFEDGKPQKLTAFQFVAAPPNAADTERVDPKTVADSAAQAADPHNRVFVVYLDMYHTTYTDAHASHAPLLEFLRRTMGPSDLFGVVSPEGPRPVLQLVFGRRIDTLVAELAKYGDWGLADQEQMPQGRLPIEERLQTCFTPKDPDLGKKLVALQREDTFMAGLEALTVYLRDVRDERKNVLFISGGWRPEPPDAALLKDIDLMSTRPAVGTGPTGQLGVGVPLPGTVDHSWCNQQIGRLASIDFRLRFRDCWRWPCGRTSRSMPST
jgi:VWFA-related protein